MKSHTTLIVTLFGLVLIAVVFFPASRLVGPTHASPDPCDVDEDGYTSSSCQGGNDCNDYDPAVNPGAEEICNDSVDNDCDGDTDFAARQIACANMQWVWLPDDCLCSSATPIIVDMGGDGCRMTDALRGVDFDINGDGHKERLSWTVGDAEEGFLTLDRNGNGQIDGGTELFGNFTAQPASPEKNGFLALAEYDKPGNGGNGDGMISVNDSVFTSLRLWEDRNHDGASTPTELHTLGDYSINAIELKYRTSNKSDSHGNVFRYRAKVHSLRGPSAGRWVWDVVLLAQ